MRACTPGRDVRVVEVGEAPEDFHARFSARGKTYRYRIFNERFASPFWSRYALHEGRPLDLGAMRDCARLFIGEHDWTAFSAAQTDVRTRVRRVTRLDVSERRSVRGRGRLIEITAGADGFLRYMVRSIAGTLLAAGRGEMDARAIKLAIEGGDRSQVAATAAAHGLTLVEVHY
jgi:tRNA pseudouridine38-40 synthase